jgi:hypothetical protein
MGEDIHDGVTLGLSRVIEDEEEEERGKKKVSDDG